VDRSFPSSRLSFSHRVSAVGNRRTQILKKKTAWRSPTRWLPLRTEYNISTDWSQTMKHTSIIIIIVGVVIIIILVVVVVIIIIIKNSHAVVLDDAS
jgi:hypothetical protein